MGPYKVSGYLIVSLPDQNSPYNNIRLRPGGIGEGRQESLWGADLFRAPALSDSGASRVCTPGCSQGQRLSTLLL